ncbi:divergent polysaccharide deacetylase family protein [Gluconobacter cerinus]|uniref:divergent polysaccharide deacetylase family protein n=1 Tax=Gluconobacter cerinus TaxID=38307 RepID=UPI001B8D62AA|nr:divergent polysaccharide deacetylase family protein [Gluconobacter cerinus]
MQNRPASSRSGLWSRLPVIGRLLIVFWGVVLVGGTAAALMLRHQTPADVPPQKTKMALAIPSHPPAKTASGEKTSPPATPVNQSSKAALNAHSSVSPAQPASAIKMPEMPPPIAQTTHTDLATITASGKSVVAIVLEGFGYSDAMTYDVLSRIPEPVAVGVSPYLGNLTDVLSRAHAAHRETYVTLPMQSANPEQVDEGPHALGYGNSEAEDRQELDWCLSQAKGATGLTDASEAGDSQPADGYATTPAFQSLADTISSRGFLYISRFSQEDRHIRGMTASTWINGDTDAKTLDAKFAALVPEGAKPTHVLLMMGPLTPVAIDRLEAWLKSPAAERFILVPPSALADNGTTDHQASIQSTNIQTAPL